MKNRSESTPLGEESQNDSHNSAPSLEDFLIGQDDATKEKYAAELEHANGEWQKPISVRYAESLVYFGELERNTEMLYSDTGRLLGSRVRFRKASKTTTGVNISAQLQTEEAS